MDEQRRPRRSDGIRTYEMILQAAADFASVDGLEGLTIGSLAERLGLSKSGLFTHFGSKEGLQLATIEAARRRYVASVLEPALRAPRGIARLEALCEQVIDYMDKPEFPGGCFFCVVGAEFHARPGAIRDAIVKNKSYKRTLLDKLANEAKELGEFAQEVNAEQLAYELEAVIDAANWSVADENKDCDLQHARSAVARIMELARPRTARRTPAARTKKTSRRPKK